MPPGYGKHELTRLLIERGADCEARNVMDFETALHWAAQSKNREPCIRILLDVGADISAENRDGRTPLHFAAMKGCPENTRALVASGANCEASASASDWPLHLAAADGSPENIHVLLNFGADVKARNGYCSSFSPLHFAARSTRKNIQTLLDAGADVAVRDGDGNTAYEVARTIYRVRGKYGSYRDPVAGGLWVG